ncbi:MAG: hypothetical protein KAT05_08515 [Spirochaetes bacterium]|nr:hypothetical protein [Spirochaetota bacterium]
MKKKKFKYFYLASILSVLFLFSMCAPKCATLEKNEVGFHFNPINFGGDWSHYETVENVDQFVLDARTSPLKDDPVQLNHTISYKSKGSKRIPVVNSFNTSASYIIDIEAQNASINYWVTRMTITTDFRDSSNDRTVDTVKDKAWIQDQTNNSITLNYSMDGQPSLDIDIEVEEWYCVSNAFNYNVDWDFVHKASHNNGSKDDNINIIVMAEGYRADQIDDYITYVNDAFANTANFHYLYNDLTLGEIHQDNEFFAKYWDRINVIRMDTISPESGIDNCWYDDVQSILNMNVYYNGAPDFFRIYEVLYQTKPNGIQRIWDADVIIVLVNSSNIWAYSYAYGYEMGYRSGQPVHPVIIQAPKDKDLTDPDFHDYVKTDAIAHELGHAIARLQDEYEEDKYAKRLYCPKFRNVDDDDNLKWQTMIDMGYDDCPRFPVSKYVGGFYKSSGIYRPTDFSTMRGSSSAYNFGPQFGPVNTYHMTASFMIRMGETPESDQWGVSDDPDTFEWRTYNLESFEIKWPPEKF